MVKVKSLRQIVNSIRRYNVLALNKNKITAVGMHPTTWAQLFEKAKGIYAIKNLFIRTTEEFPDNLISTLKRDTPLGDISMKKVKTLQNVLDYTDKGYIAYMNKQTFAQLQRTKGPIMFYNPIDVKIKSVPDNVILILTGMEDNASYLGSPTFFSSDDTHMYPSLVDKWNGVI
jgi:hypothetical protein